MKKRIELEINAGERIDKAVAKMFDRLKSKDDSVVAQFNDIELVASLDKTPRQVVDEYHEECARRHEKYINSEDYKSGKTAVKHNELVKRQQLQQLLAIAPLEPTFVDRVAWCKTVAANNDPYGAATVGFAFLWMRLMEGQIASGVKLKDCAEKMAHLANTEGITGFMYGCAVGIASKVWKHGEELRRWHNLDAQIKDEGEKANEFGSVLNPAILNISV